MAKNAIFFLVILTTLLQACVGYNIVVDSQPKPKTFLHKTGKPAYGWEAMPVFTGDDRPEEPYELMLRITVTGNQGAPFEKLLKRMRKEASCYGAEAILLMDNRAVVRNTFDGVSTALNVISIVAFFDSGGGSLDLPMTSAYEAYELEGIAIRYKPGTH
jgi:hypothetical protein